MPRGFRVNEQPGAGHNISLGHTAADYHSSVFSFAEECVATADERGGRLMDVGFIGLGSQGGPMAGRIVEAGFPTTLWARRPGSLEPFADTAADVAGSPAELAAASDLVCLCVVGDADVDEVVTGANGVLAGINPAA